MHVHHISPPPRMQKIKPFRVSLTDCATILCLDAFSEVVLKLWQIGHFDVVAFMYDDGLVHANYSLGIMK